jgi:2'-phosphotransferase
LRHHAVDYKLDITTDGYVLCDDILKIQQFSKFNIDDITTAVETNDKQRFALKEENGKMYIRANQGHSHKVASKIKQDELLTKLTEPLSIVHGTSIKAYEDIKIIGLKRFKRSHVHFNIYDNNFHKTPLRENRKILIHLNMELAMNDGIEFYISQNNVVLSPGIGNEGLIDKKYFDKVTDRVTGDIIYQS